MKSEIDILDTYLLDVGLLTRSRAAIYSAKKLQVKSVGIAIIPIVRSHRPQDTTEACFGGFFEASIS
jgi:hypothetical protein